MSPKMIFYSGRISVWVCGILQTPYKIRPGIQRETSSWDPSDILSRFSLDFLFPKALSARFLCGSSKTPRGISLEMFLGNR